MRELQASRTLVKSAPELWEVCSDPDRLSRHLQAFGEIRITRVEPQSTVAWEGERVSGTVQIEPSGWGTRVTLTAQAQTVLARVAEPVEPAAVAQPEPERVAEPDPEPVVEPEPVAEAEPVAGVEAEPALDPAEDAVPPVASAVQAPRYGLFRRIGGLLFRSFVTPVEIHDDAFGPCRQDDEPDAVDAAAQACVPSEPEPGPAIAARVPEPAPAPEPEPEAPPADPVAESEPRRAPKPELDPKEALQAALSSLGSDHHRPFSRT